ncbi:hypothetical protein SADUNF_Sadunf07G0038400 [Salix dunnii]|uniref:Uncharacterized protein n=1 Tax=Salix dunnii TaxID=1413687 RepID=A0A835MYT9_9ROSI|nr:hypothetical protein SADUNF_Sadunf07G0038400 [Salix dunnii]
MANPSTNTNLHHNSTAVNQKVSLTSPPVHIPGVHHSKIDRKESQPMVPRSSDSPSVKHPKTPGANYSSNGHSVTAFEDDFEPTTPGYSPGAGYILVHKHQDDNEDVDPKAPASGSNFGRAGAAFKPTTPGHSPGIGHMSLVDQSDMADPKTSNFEHSITTPGHNLGVDHIHADEEQDDNEDADPKTPGSGSNSGHAGAAFKPTKPGHSPGVGHMSSVDHSDKTDQKASNFEHSVTTPVHSPRVVHILGDKDQDDSEDVDPKAPASGSNFGRAGAAFKPTTPGHSPGIGHISSVDQSDKTDPKASNFEHSVTTPGHSPGVGHIHVDEEQDDSEDADPKAPGSSSNSGHSGAAFKPTKPGHSPGVGHMSSVDPSDKPNPKASNFEHSVTTPGHSPGVVHIYADEEIDDNEDVDPKAPDSGSGTRRAGAAFKPTKPGHSPGVGHISSVDQSDKTKPKASNFEHYVTTPGHSPRVDHILADEEQDDSEDVVPKAPGSGSANEDQGNSEDVDPMAPASGSNFRRAGAAFKPTTPGHSPGIGHMSSVDQSYKTDPKAPNIEHSVTKVPDNFQPTLPGHGTGVGDALEAKKKN